MNVKETSDATFPLSIEYCREETKTKVTSSRKVPKLSVYVGSVFVRLLMKLRGEVYAYREGV
jgi:hypothetical protein